MTAINVVSNGQWLKSLELLATAQWWIVCLKCIGDPIGAVYIGKSWTVEKWIAYHQEHFGVADLLTAYPFDDREAYLEAILPLEQEFMEYIKNGGDRDDSHRDQRQAGRRKEHHRPGHPVGAP